MRACGSVIALTNRRELVDNAILRPGRLEVHVAVGKPDEKGRKEILRIHAEKMRASGRLNLGGPSSGSADECVLEVPEEGAYDEWLGELASRTEGFSGAAMAALVRGAVARALDRSVEANDADGCRVTTGDFDGAIEDLRTSSLELEEFSDGEEGTEQVEGEMEPALVND